jgi:hypothetical protein
MGIGESQKLRQGCVIVGGGIGRGSTVVFALT